MAVTVTPALLALDAARATYRRTYERLMRQAEQAQTDEAYAAVLAKLAVANEKLDAAKAAVDRERAPER